MKRSTLHIEAKIRACIALAKSTTFPGEAAAALDRARALCDRHGLSRQAFGLEDARADTDAGSDCRYDVDQDHPERRMAIEIFGARPAPLGEWFVPWQQQPIDETELFGFWCDYSADPAGFVDRLKDRLASSAAAYAGMALD